MVRGAPYLHESVQPSCCFGARPTRCVALGGVRLAAGSDDDDDDSSSSGPSEESGAVVHYELVPRVLQRKQLRAGGAGVRDPGRWTPPACRHSNRDLPGWRVWAAVVWGVCTAAGADVQRMQQQLPVTA